MPNALQKYRKKTSIGSSHTWALKYLQTLNPDITILDFGAGSGIIGEKLKAKGFSNLSAIDIDPEAKQELKKHYQYVANDLNELQYQQYDCILLLDILEHLHNPFTFLQEIANKLNTSGLLLISVPNIAHWSIRLSLFFGFFEYTNRGILDKTHYHFFTKKRALQLADYAPGLQIKNYSVSTSPAEFILPEWICNNNFYTNMDKLRLKIANLFPGLLGYQHLIKLQKQ